MVIDIVDAAGDDLEPRCPRSPAFLVERRRGFEIECHGDPDEHHVDPGVGAREGDHGRLWRAAPFAWAGSEGERSSSTAAESPPRSGREPRGAGPGAVPSADGPSEPGLSTSSGSG